VTFPSTALASYDMQPPVVGGTGPIAPQQITGTGTTGASHTTALTVGQMATLQVGAAAVRVRFAASQSLAASTAATDPLLGPYSRFDWLVSSSNAFVGCEADSGAYEASVWTSSGAR
jgi:hypothetical protein